MELMLRRTTMLKTHTVGELRIADGGGMLCYICEDTVRPPGVKKYGETAIPEGRYRVIITMSPRFRVEMPVLVAVPGFEGVRIHPGNGPGDTEGCLLPGRYETDTGVAKSRDAYNELSGKIREALTQESVWITVSNTGPSPWSAAGSRPAT